jgi:sugar/nucleoside kinase (ribokinase family)
MAGDVLCAVGDLVDDVVVWLDAPIATGTDTPSRIFHRRGGSAANVAAAAARAGRAARFIGRVGDDLAGQRVVAELLADGVDVRVQTGGRTGTVVVLVAPDGERTMLADRGSAIELSDVPPAWLDGIGALHVTSYSLVAEPVAATTCALAEAARERGALLTLDASSVSVLEELGMAQYRRFLERLRPDVLFANAAEAELLDLPQLPAAGIGLVVVKRGARPAVVVDGDGCTEVPPPRRVLPATDSTGAGDAFAAGFLDAWLDGGDAVAATEAGHVLAATVLDQPGASAARASG